MPVQLLALDSCLSASRTTPENPWQWCHILKIIDLSCSAPCTVLCRSWEIIFASYKTKGTKIGPKAPGFLPVVPKMYCWSLLSQSITGSWWASEIPWCSCCRIFFLLQECKKWSEESACPQVMQFFPELDSAIQTWWHHATSFPDLPHLAVLPKQFFCWPFGIIRSGLVFSSIVLGLNCPWYSPQLFFE